MRLACVIVAATAAVACSTAEPRPIAKDPVSIHANELACHDNDVKGCEAACDAGSMDACNEAGHLYELGLGTTRDEIAAAAFYRRACNAGDMQGCFNAGYMLETGQAGRQDVHCAFAMYDYACNGGYARACMTAGFMLKAGVDVPKDDEKATTAFKKACAAGIDAGCKQLTSP